MMRIHPRWSGVLLLWCLGAVPSCSRPEAEQDGIETSPCVDGACLGELVCLSDVCVVDEATEEGPAPEDGGTGSAPGEDDGEAPPGNPGPDSTTGADGSDDSGATCGVGGLPQGSTCDPSLDECEPCSRCGDPRLEQWQTEVSEACAPGFGCYPLGDGGGHCVPHPAGGVSNWGDSCDVQSECSPGFVCELGGILMSWVLCKQLCELGSPAGCADLQSLESYEIRCGEAWELALPRGLGVCEYVDSRR